MIHIIIYFLAFLPSFRVSPPLLPQPMDRGLLQIGITVLASCQYSWQGAKICKSPRIEASCDSAMRGVCLHVYYIYFGQ